MARSVCILVAFVTAIVFATGAATAQGKKTSPADKAKARAHYDAAVAHEEKGAWDQAIAEYEAAYALFPDPEFYYLIAEANAKKGDKQAALVYYDRYLVADPKGRVSGPARTKSTALRTELAAEREAARKAAAEEAARKAAAEEAARKAAAAPPPVTAPPEDVVSEAPPARAGRGLRIGGMASAGVGVVALGLGIKFGLDARAAERDVEQMWDPARADDGEAANRNMIILSSVGVTAIAAGAVLYVLGRRAGARTSERLSVAPALTADSAQVVVVARF